MIEGKKKSVRKILIGKVVSDKMDKTIVVKVERSYMEPRLRKVMRAAKKYKVHDGQQVAQVGDIVSIYEGRPLSKSKYMYLEKVIQSRHK